MIAAADARAMLLKVDTHIGEFTTEEQADINVIRSLMTNRIASGARSALVGEAAKALKKFYARVEQEES